MKKAWPILAIIAVAVVALAGDKSLQDKFIGGGIVLAIVAIVLQINKNRR